MRRIYFCSFYLDRLSSNRKMSKLFFIKSNKDCIGVQFLYLRYRMTGPVGGEPYRFFTYRSELEVSREGFLEKYFTHAVGYTSCDLIFYKDFTPSRGYRSRDTARPSV